MEWIGRGREEDGSGLRERERGSEGLGGGWEWHLGAVLEGLDVAVVELQRPCARLLSAHKRHTHLQPLLAVAGAGVGNTFLHGELHVSGTPAPTCTTYTRSALSSLRARAMAARACGNLASAKLLVCMVAGKVGGGYEGNEPAVVKMVLHVVEMLVELLST